jgi:VCBS repeat-containing protein
VTAVTSLGNPDSVASSEGGVLTIAGQHGVLTIEPNGSYSYTRNPGTPGGVFDDFRYTLTDGDTSSDLALLRINIADSGTSLDVPTEGEAGTQVQEKGLPARDGESQGSGEEAAAGTDGDTSEKTNGVITFNAEDGPAVVAIDGVVVAGAGQTFEHPNGILTITSYSYDPGTGNGSI